MDSDLQSSQFDGSLAASQLVVYEMLSWRLATASVLSLVKGVPNAAPAKAAIKMVWIMMFVFLGPRVLMSWMGDEEDEEERVKLRTFSTLYIHILCTLILCILLLCKLRLKTIDLLKLIRSESLCDHHGDPRSTHC